LTRRERKYRVGRDSRKGEEYRISSKENRMMK
jgi:hypothetical protein